MKPLIVGNWKCNPTTLKEAGSLSYSIMTGIEKINNVEVVICPPFVFLPSLINNSISFGAQDCYFEDKGAFTGEVSGLMLKEIGCKYVIVGHSERRTMFDESNREINLKIQKVINLGMIPILCIGENREDREEGETFEVLMEQLEGCLEGIEKDKIKKIVIAYEPVWAIGTGKYAEVSKIEEVKHFIREFLTKKYDKDISEKIKILYGGSVDSNNARLYIKEAGMDGVLVGGASIKSDEFIKIIKSL